MMKKVSRIIVVLLVVTMMLPMTVMAKAKNPYKDVTRKKVDALSYQAIVFVKDHGGWKGISRKGRLKPNKFITRRELVTILDNLYPNRVPVTIDDFRSKRKVTSKEVCDLMVIVAANLGYKIKWTGNATKMRRKDLARYIRIFATYNPALMPIR